MVLRPKTRESGSPPGPTDAPDTAPEAGGRRGGGQRSTTPRHETHGRPREPQATGHDAGWSSPVARQAHNLKVAGSNPAPATTPPSDASVQPVARACSASARYQRSFSANDSRTSPLGDGSTTSSTFPNSRSACSPEGACARPAAARYTPFPV